MQVRAELLALPVDGPGGLRERAAVLGAAPASVTRALGWSGNDVGSLAALVGGLAAAVEPWRTKTRAALPLRLAPFSFTFENPYRDNA